MKSSTAVGTIFMVTLIVFFVLDATWLSLVAIKVFQNQLGALLRPELMLGPAIALYLVYPIGLVVLAVRPALAARSLSVAAFNGAMVGLTAYATFDLTNLAVIQGWTVSLAAMDMVWGVVVSTIASLAGYSAGARLGESRE